MWWRRVDGVVSDRLTTALAVAALWLLVSPCWADDSLVLKAVPASAATDVPLGWSASAYLYDNHLTTSSDNIFTNVHTDMTGGLAAFEYRFPWLSVAVLGNFGHTHVMYLQLPQDNYTSSGAVGVRGRAYLGPFTFTLSTSTANDKFHTITLGSDDMWDGSERAVYGKMALDFPVAGPVWFDPFVGARYLALTQDTHTLGLATIPEETRTSQLGFAGAKLELKLRDERNNLLRPWLFGGVTHEYEDTPPMGPSVFVTEGMAGNEYTLFPPGTTGVPAVYPGRSTEAFGAGVDMDFAKVLTLNAGIYREFNSEYTSTTYKLGADVRW
jgi:hypothetical protein